MNWYISATSLKDFLECSKRYQWRVTAGEEAEQTEAMKAGTIVHLVLEKFWDKDRSYNLVKGMELAESNQLSNAYIDRVGNCINSYHDNFAHLLTDKDEVELKFKLKLEENIFLVGKIDRVVQPAGLVLDWKTSQGNVYTIKNDIQFLIYYYAFTQIYNHPPSLVSYVALQHGKMINLVNFDKEYNYLIQEVLPGVVLAIKSGNFYRSGIFQNKCNKCQFKEVCLGQ